MYEILFDALLIVIVGLTALAVYSRDLLKSAIFLSLGALCTALVFFLLNAPDIAITKAAIEAGMATAIFIVAIQKTSRFEKERPKSATKEGRRIKDRRRQKERRRPRTPSDKQPPSNSETPSIKNPSPSSHKDNKLHKKASLRRKV
jgi:uncharacterized MnhB-related membrane protein